MLDNLAIAPPQPQLELELAPSGIMPFIAANVPEPRAFPTFSHAEEARKREEYLLQNTALRMKIVSSAITFAERNMPAHLRRNQPRVPHQKFE